ncbi:MAG: hypothetical protein LQ345_003993 [Seirophora villosa]|nr:MAG: hypothetical protein LQ345_003993 [Seirophora villosa]
MMARQQHTTVLSSLFLLVLLLATRTVLGAPAPQEQQQAEDGGAVAGTDGTVAGSGSAVNITGIDTPFNTSSFDSSSSDDFIESGFSTPTVSEFISQEEAENEIRQLFLDDKQIFQAIQANPYTPEESASIAAADASYSSFTATAIESSVPDVVDLPPTRDPCGPTEQDGTLINTCTRNPDGTRNIDGWPLVTLGTSPSYYGILCEAYTPAAGAVKPNINFDKCDFSKICNAAQSASYSRDQWHWDESGGEGCAVGIFLPGGDGVAVTPDAVRCSDGIYGEMGLWCSGGGPNSQVASVNIQKLPGGGSTGEAANAGYPSYIIAPRPLI